MQPTEVRMSWNMKFSAFPPIALCLALGACASVPPVGPRVTAVAADNVSDKKFTQDDAACRARAQSVTDKEAANGEGGLQRHYDQIYADCMMDRGHHVEAPMRPRYYGPAPYYYGPGPYWGPGFYYGGGWGRRW
jgi:hypothetical protein